MSVPAKRSVTATRSHGRGLAAFGPNGLYLMDEPEAALSPQGCLALIRAIHDLAAAGSQFIIATHSPLLVTYPHANVYELDDDGIARVPYAQTTNFDLFRSFTEAPERFLRNLLSE